MGQLPKNQVQSPKVFLRAKCSPVTGAVWDPPLSFLASPVTKSKEAEIGLTILSWTKHGQQHLLPQDWRPPRWEVTQIPPSLCISLICSCLLHQGAILSTEVLDRPSGGFRAWIVHQLALSVGSWQKTGNAIFPYMTKTGKWKTITIFTKIKVL